MQCTLAAFKQRTNVIKIVRQGLIQSGTSSTTTTVSLIVYMWDIAFSIKSQRNADQVRWRHNISCGPAIILLLGSSANRKEYIYIYVYCNIEICKNTQKYHCQPREVERTLCPRITIIRSVAVGAYADRKDSGLQREDFPTHPHCYYCFKWKGLRSFKKSMNLGLGVIYSFQSMDIVNWKGSDICKSQLFQKVFMGKKG